VGLCEVKARKGLIRVRTEVAENKISDILVTGDFFMYPEEALWKLEEALRGIEVDYGKIRKVIERVFRELNVALVGASLDDFVNAVWCSLSGS